MTPTKIMVAWIVVSNSTLAIAQQNGNWKQAECNVSVTSDAGVLELVQRTFVVQRGNCSETSSLPANSICRLRVREKDQSQWSKEIRVMDPAQNTVTLLISTARAPAATTDGRIQIEATARNPLDRPIFQMKFAQSAQMTIPLRIQGMSSTFSVNCAPTVKLKK